MYSKFALVLSAGTAAMWAGASWLVAQIDPALMNETVKQVPALAVLAFIVVWALRVSSLDRQEDRKQVSTLIEFFHESLNKQREDFMEARDKDRAHSRDIALSGQQTLTSLVNRIEGKKGE